ncbi:MAG: hypothetical protein EOP39_04390 [Rubrivivax sp.]|nr:MAG: hypothetical protein EOP39_04390 [Rubrivivax sp.]
MTFIVTVNRQRVVDAYEALIASLEPLQRRVEALEGARAVHEHRHAENQRLQAGHYHLGLWHGWDGEYLAHHVSDHMHEAKWRSDAARAADGDTVEMNAVEVIRLQAAEDGTSASNAAAVVERLESLVAGPLEPLWEPPPPVERPVVRSQPSVSRTFWQSFWAR